MENSDLKEKRESLFSYLDHVLNVSKEKFDKEKASNGTRQKWARIIVSAVQAYGKLLEAVQLESLSERLTVLELKVGETKS